jgi:hypothetical protein
MAMSHRLINAQKAVSKLTEAELRAFSQWFVEYDQKCWEREIARDSRDGRLDFLLDEARTEN